MKLVSSELVLVLAIFSISYLYVSAAPGIVEKDPKRFENVYASQMDKQMRELFAMGFKCKIVLDFAHPLCEKCCEHQGQKAIKGRLQDNCECVDREPNEQLPTPPQETVKPSGQSTLPPKTPPKPPTPPAGPPAAFPMPPYPGHLPSTMKKSTPPSGPPPPAPPPPPPIRRV